MAVRIEIRQDESIEVMWARGEIRPVFMTFSTIDEALKQARYFLKRDLAEVRDDAFVPRLDEECSRELRKFINQQQGENEYA